MMREVIRMMREVIRMMREVIRMHSEPSERHRARQRTELLLGAPEQSVAISRNQHAAY
jgi:hypothetical protein